MPRPRKQAQDRRTRRISMRVSHDEDARIAERAREAGMPVAAFALHQLICGPIEKRRSPALPFLLTHHLMRISVNLRQLLAVPDAAEIHPVVFRLRSRIQPIVDSAIDRDLEISGYDDEDRKLKRFVRVTQDQHVVITALAAQAGRSVADYAREMLTTGRVVVRQTTEQDFPALDDLRELGIALNRKTYRGNALVETPFGLPSILAGIDALVDAIPGA